MPAERRGSRWLHDQPTEAEVKEWFEVQPLHPGMSHGPYLGGVVLIAATEKVKVTMRKQNGETYVRENEQVVYVPYIRVDTRIAYFRDYVRSLNDGKEQGDFVGVIEPVEVPVISDRQSPFYNGHLPRGFSVMPLPNSEANSFQRYLVCTARVAIYERESYAQLLNGKETRPILEGTGSKQSVMNKRYADDNALMKAETGAVGRALGMAGMLVVGTGVATAEDVQEALTASPGAGATDGAVQAALPVDDGSQPPADAPPAEAPPAEDAPAAEKTVEQQDEELRATATALLAELEKDHPDARAAYVEWWKGRGFGNLSELTGPALKGAVTKLERDLDAAKNPPAQ